MTPRGSRGSYAVLFLPAALAVFAASVLVLNVGRALLVQEKAQTVSDATLLSALRIKVEGLRAIAERWAEFGPLFGTAASNGVVEVRSADVPTLQAKADTLRRAISGYKGRITAVVKVVSDANGIDRSLVEIPLNAASDLGVVPEVVVMKDEKGASSTLPAAWYRRTWSLEEQSRHSTQLKVTRVHAPGEQGAPAWSVHSAGGARLRWDVDAADAEVRSSGNGGYPRSWAEALNGGRLDPFRFPLYRAGLAGEEL